MALKDPQSHLVSIRQLYRDRKSTRLNSSHSQISYAVFCLKKKISNIQSSAYSIAYGKSISALIGMEQFSEYSLRPRTSYTFAEYCSQHPRLPYPTLPTASP